MPLTFSETQVAYVLKEATHELHKQAEARLYPKLDGIASLNDYSSILKMFYGFFHPMEAIIAPFITDEVLNDFPQRRKSDLITDDLHAIGRDRQNMIACSLLPEVDSVPRALGAMYVMEGSTLGGRMIAKMLLKNSNISLSQDQIRFFNGYGEETGPKWIGFQKVLNQYKNQEGQLVASANQTFSLFTRWIEQTLYHESKDQL